MAMTSEAATTPTGTTKTTMTGSTIRSSFSSYVQEKVLATTVGTWFLLLTTMILIACFCSSSINNNGNNSSSSHSVRRRILQQMNVVTGIAPDPSAPLALCEGDCDNDNDCQGDLICFVRNADEAVPGCIFDGLVYASMDVCIYSDALTQPTDSPISVSQPTVAPKPTMAPTVEGTNSWAQTWGMTEPFVFVGPPVPTPAPTVQTPVPTYDMSGYEWLLNLTESQQPFELVGDDRQPASVYPLGPCQADCDRDSDCAGPLICWQRTRQTDTVPTNKAGCIGEANSNGDDYCIWPEGYFTNNDEDSESDMGVEEEETDLLDNSNNKWVRNGFGLKLYWEKGYRWQDLTTEQEWCISREYRVNEIACWYGLDQINCEPDQLYMARCDREDPRQRFKFQPVSSDEVLIAAYNHRTNEDENRCMYLDARQIFLKECDEKVHNQRFFAVRGGFNERRFELSSKTQPDRCVNNDHHPKWGEVLRMHDCDIPRLSAHNTSWWDLYE